jgi:hypothetical protein
LRAGKPGAWCEFFGTEGRLSAVTQEPILHEARSIIKIEFYF